MLQVRYVTERDLEGERGPRLLRFLLDHGADEFTIVVMALQDTQAPFVDAFEEEMGPFERPMAPRRLLSAPSTPASTRPVRLWSFDERSLRRLVTFLHDGLFHWPAGPDGWFEDLTIYRAGELVFGALSHAREGVLRLTPEEHAAVARLDIHSTATSEWIGY
jgi:hypothetical protein